jgi:predicted RNA-binding Zn ribbon-like protein
MDRLDTSMLKFVGGSLCLDFVNTADRASDGTIIAEGLIDDAAWTLWLRRAEIAASTPPLEVMLPLREAIWRTFSALARREMPNGDDWHRLESLAASARARQHWMRTTDGRYERTLADDTENAALLSLALSVDDLICSPSLAFVRQCDGDACGWLFVDTSKSRRRRWCDMSDCGNRAKARAFSERQK